MINVEDRAAHCRRAREIVIILVRTYLSKLRAAVILKRLALLTVEIQPDAGSFAGWCDGAQRIRYKCVNTGTLET